MSLRLASRAPAKRMLVWCTSDSSTSILDTKRIKKIVGDGKLVEGATVVVDYGGNIDYEAIIIKLHDDPSVLSEHETAHLESLHLEEQLEDKENLPKAKRIKTNTEPKTPRPQKAKPAKETTKSKKIISIEAETAPTAKSCSLPPSTDDNKPGSLNFLDASEQIKVQKLLEDFKKGEGKQVAVQTEATAPTCPCKDFLNGISEKLDYVISTIALLTQELKKGGNDSFSLDNILQLSTSPVPNPTMDPPAPAPFSSPSVPLPILPTISSATPLFVTSDPQVSFTATSSVPSPAPVSPNTSVPATTTPFSFANSVPSTNIPKSTPFPSTTTLPPATPVSLITAPIPCKTTPIPVPTTSVPLSTVPDLFSTLPSPEFSGDSSAQQRFEEIFRESSSMGNYAKNLVFKLFAKHELLGANCAGVKNKRCLEQDQRMEIVKEAVFKKYGQEDKKKSWATCRKAIDCAIRHLKPNV